LKATFAASATTYAGHSGGPLASADLWTPGAVGARDNSGVASMNEMADYIAGNLANLGIEYVIWKQRIHLGGAWDPMNDRGSITQNHYDHVHITFRSNFAAMADDAEMFATTKKVEGPRPAGQPVFVAMADDAEMFATTKKVEGPIPAGPVFAAMADVAEMGFTKKIDTTVTPRGPIFVAVADDSEMAASTIKIGLPPNSFGVADDVSNAGSTATSSSSALPVAIVLTVLATIIVVAFVVVAVAVIVQKDI
jgi:hypothetical protein